VPRPTEPSAPGSGPRRDAAALRAALGESRSLVWATILFSLLVNALMLTGPLYMLLIHDRVLASRSEPTLVALTLLASGLFLAMGLIDHARGRLMTIVGARFQDRLDRRVLALALSRSSSNPSDIAASTAERDLEAIRAFLASPVLLALIDVPWTPVFLAAIFVFHPLLGWLSVAGGAVLITTALLNQSLSRRQQTEAALAALRADRQADRLRAEAEVIQALGMTGRGIDRWQTARREALQSSVALAGLSGGFSTLTRTFRLFLQSAMLGLGAWLALRGEISAGAMIASSILMGRALAPIESAVGQWALLQRAQTAWVRLAALLAAERSLPHRTSLPRPAACLEVEALTVVPPGGRAAGLRGLSFRVDAGQALGVIGPSGAGKSTLARALTGVWPAASGRICLGGAPLEQYDPTIRTGLIGYLPQRVTLFDGTVAENIARFDPDPDSARIVTAACKADAHTLILGLEDGYDSPISGAVCRLSGGQVQRIGLARALYGDPVIVILDEPNASLDAPGSQALNAAIRTLKSEGRVVIVMAHRPSAIEECELILVLEDGQPRAFGNRDEVLRAQVRNHSRLVGAAPDAAA
jgi:ATP-binding cassette, subfamily C, bacterial